MTRPDSPTQRDRAGGPGVDTASALEFQTEIGQRASEADLRAIAVGLERKSTALRALLGDGAARLDRAGLRQVLRWVFATRRRADAILDAAGPGPLAAAVDELLAGHSPLPDRFEAFGAFAAPLPVVGFELASELLHFTEPGEYWLWTRWLWEPVAGTGALALVTDGASVLAGGGTVADTYLAVGRATAFLDETGKAAGFTTAGPGLFGADVFLAGVYAVYMTTVLRMRMTQEFTKLVPSLPDLARRLLGVYHLEV